MSADKKQKVIQILDYIREAVVAVLWLIAMINPNVFNNLASGVIISCLLLLSAFWTSVREKIPHDEKERTIKKKNYKRYGSSASHSVFRRYFLFNVKMMTLA